MDSFPERSAQTRPLASAELLFTRFLGLLWTGQRPDFEALCRDHPDQAPRLLELLAAEKRASEERHAASLAGAQTPESAAPAAPAPETPVTARRSAGSANDASSEILRRLSATSTPHARYELQGEIARGGMGVILRVWDTSLKRHLAMKVILPRPSAENETTQADSRTLGRFLEEAQITGQLDHPGIVPVHELGLDAQGRVFFAMKLVKGEDLRSIYDKVKKNREGWTQTRALGVLLKVCEAMSYAHSKGVIHRDLKPGNVMVGRFGEVFVMDWGLARVLDGEDGKDIRIAGAPSTSALRSERQDLAHATPDSPLMTMDGDVVGTPAYMPPEQALGHLEEMGPHSDVYAVGAMLYQLLAGHMPYVKPGMNLSNYAVWYRVQEGPPDPLAERAAGAPDELVAICDKAMARDGRLRYRDMGELGLDLQAFLERRVVRAYRTGAFAELRKWMERNRGLASSIAAGVLAILVGLGASLALKAQSDRNAVLARESERIAEERRLVAEQRAEEARERRDEVLRLSAFQQLDDLVAEADALWPAYPERLRQYDDWIERARELVAGLDPRPDAPDGFDKGHRVQLAELRARALPLTPEEIEQERSASPDRPARRSWRFTTEQETWWHGQLEDLVARIEALEEPALGLIEGVSPDHGWGIARRRAWADRVAVLTLNGAEAARRWQEAIASIGDAAECPAYGGLSIEPQLGLLPIGRDGRSGLWEFVLLQTGEAPARDEHGELRLTEDSGLVLVLLPGGTFAMGAQASDPTGVNYDPLALPDEGPVHQVTLAPFFLSKYEMTQGQWLRFTGKNPSLFGPDDYRPEWNCSLRAADLLHPVERVSWDECSAVCAWLGLSLPTEAQWEYADRAAASGAAPASAAADLAQQANLADQWARAHGAPPAWDFEEWDDGNALHATVGSYAPNAFGLHDLIGNLAEWCSDGYAGDAYARGPVQDPLVEPGRSTFRVTRGGGFSDPLARARCTLRNPDTPGRADANLGLRPARLLAGR